MATVNEHDLYRWRDEQARDAVRYHANNGHFAEMKDGHMVPILAGTAFEAGFKEGYREAIANLKLHAAINLT